MEEVDTFYITMNFSIPCPNNSACVPKMDTLKRMNENTHDCGPCRVLAGYEKGYTRRRKGRSQMVA